MHNNYGSDDTTTGQQDFQRDYGGRGGIFAAMRGNGVTRCRLPHNGDRISDDAMEQRHVVDWRLVIFRVVLRSFAYFSRTRFLRKNPKSSEILRQIQRLRGRFFCECS